jgi:hypothetical protein
VWGKAPQPVKYIIFTAVAGKFTGSWQFTARGAGTGTGAGVGTLQCVAILLRIILIQVEVLYYKGQIK